MKKLLLFVVLAVLLILPAQASSVGGDVLHSNVRAFIDEKPIRSYNIKGYTYIVAEDLLNYGFFVEWNGVLKTLTIHEQRTAEPDAYVPIAPSASSEHTPGTFAMHYYLTDIRTFIGTREITGYNIGGSTCINFDDLNAAFGVSYTWDAATSTLSLKTYEDKPVCEIKGHDFAPATYKAPETCRVCGETRGKALDANLLYEDEFVKISYDGFINDMEYPDRDWLTNKEITETCDVFKLKVENKGGKHIDGTVYPDLWIRLTGYSINGQAVSQGAPFAWPQGCVSVGKSIVLYCDTTQLPHNIIDQTYYGSIDSLSVSFAMEFGMRRGGDYSYSNRISYCSGDYNPDSYDNEFISAGSKKACSEKIMINQKTDVDLSIPESEADLVYSDSFIDVYSWGEDSETTSWLYLDVVNKTNKLIKFCPTEFKNGQSAKIYKNFSVLSFDDYYNLLPESLHSSLRFSWDSDAMIWKKSDRNKKASFTLEFPDGNSIPITVHIP